jgi:hypothetical protein
MRRWPLVACFGSCYGRFYPVTPAISNSIWKLENPKILTKDTETIGPFKN